MNENDAFRELESRIIKRIESDYSELAQAMNSILNSSLEMILKYGQNVEDGIRQEFVIMLKKDDDLKRFSKKEENMRKRNIEHVSNSEVLDSKYVDPYEETIADIWPEGFDIKKENQIEQKPKIQFSPVTQSYICSHC